MLMKKHSFDNFLHKVALIEIGCGLFVDLRIDNANVNNRRYFKSGLI